MNDQSVEDSWQNASRPFRFQARDLEAFPGLTLLLDACALVDFGVSEALAKDGRTPVCHMGCATCCTQPIPATPLEVLGVYLYARTRLMSRVRQQLQQRFSVYDGGTQNTGKPCPFAIDGACSVYPLRPIACRQFLVFETPCTPSEDVLTTRPDLVFRPQYAFMHTALRHTLPWYARQGHCPASPTPEQQQAFFASVTTILQAVPWKNYSLSRPKTQGSPE